MDSIVPAAVAVPPQTVSGRTSPPEIVRNVRVVDVATGTEIAKVIEADATAGRLSRFALDDAGNLVRENDKFSVVEEDREIRIEWITPPSEAIVPVTPAGTEEDAA